MPLSHRNSWDLALAWGRAVAAEWLPLQHTPLPSHLSLTSSFWYPNCPETSGGRLPCRHRRQRVHQLQWTEWLVQGCLLASAWVQSERNHRKPDGYRWPRPGWEDQLWWVHQGEYDAEFQEMHLTPGTSTGKKISRNTFPPSLLQCYVFFTLWLSWSQIGFVKIHYILAGFSWPKKHRGCQDL